MKRPREIDFSRHSDLRQDQRDITRELVRSAVHGGSIKEMPGKGLHGGVIKKFSCVVRDKKIVVVGELYRGTLYVITNYWDEN